MTGDRIGEEIGAVRAELGRVDTKAGLLLAVVTAALAGGVTLLGRDQPPLCVVLLVAALVATVAAGWILLGSARPNLNGGHGLVGYATATDDDIDRMVRDGSRTETLRALSRLADAKYRRQRAAVDLLRTALLLGVVAAGLTSIF
ncbi:DUF5706 domain-containing protein [Micromonospora sp. WMMD1102]|uniref:Pycsar system effector family protein n=1 Tax=Micromonospora sp. WMMD1102 TaxID=3016105 RepID=UPI0024153476|nr:Pycsar system effector family protein [Micromonospora sp. WMMD1102]MDG4792069.1 DUF5706 domain-containing protein [Micromonospora sp. WMMD1102]